MTTPAELSKEARSALRVLIDHGHMYLGVSDCAVYAELEAHGLVRTWNTFGGFPAWGLSDKAREMMQREELVL